MKSPIHRAWLIWAVVLFLSLAACDTIKDEINDKTKKTESFTLDITEDWTPLFALAYQDYSLTAVCYAEALSINDLMSVTDYADMWETVKGNISEINVKNIQSKIRDNISQGGTLDLFMVETLPPAMGLPGGVNLDDLGIDSLMWRIVEPDSLANSDLVASVDIPAGTNVSDWANADFSPKGQEKLGEQMLDFDAPFAFCLRLNVPTHGIESLDPDLEIKLRTSFDIVFTPL